MHLALLKAKELGMDCVQVFTANQRQWKPKAPTAAQVEEWHRQRKATKLKAVVSHDSYLINLGGPAGELRDKSIDAFRDELMRCELLDIPYVVTHPGAHRGDGEEEGLRRVAAALDQLHAELPGLRVVTCLEVTAGSGSALGGRFEHLRTIIDSVKDPARLGVCLDTAHLLEAGYDLTSAAGAEAVLQELADVIGHDRVKAIHVNDSKTPRGSHVDRHAHIGHGHVALDAFEVFVRKRAFARVPKILETPKEDTAEGRPWDLVNLEVLRGLMSQSARQPGRKLPRRRGK